ncbi:MAG: Bug family tripartite tricarboxylate transporter substrate binding protein [Burkholderiaceae bacterium]
MKISSLMRRLSLGLILVFALPTLYAQGYPNQSLKLVMPFAAGTAAENALRLFADKLAIALKQSVVIENKPGAGSTLGTDLVAKAPADGYTLLATFNSSIAPGPLMYNKMAYDPVKDFHHLALLGVYPQYIIVRTDHPAKSIQDFLAMAKDKPGTINYASAGVGTSGYLAAELLKQNLNLQMTHIPYKGPSPALTDLLGGRLDMVLTASASELVKAGKVRILAVTSEKRVPYFPDTPTLEEVAPGVKAVSWVGISVAASTPKAITTRLEKEITAILSTPEMFTRFSEPSIGLTPLALGSEKFSEFIAKEIHFWSPVIKAGNIKID